MKRNLLFSRNLLLSISVCFVYSCTDKSIDDFYPTQAMVTDNVKQKMAADGEWDVLGFGYDVTGAYLHPESVKDMVINTSALHLAHPELFYTNSSVYAESKYQYASTSEEYLTDKTNECSFELGLNGPKFLGMKAFGASFNYSSNIHTKLNYSSLYMYASCDVTKHIRRLYLSSPSINTLLDYLNPAFIVDLNTKSAAEIVAKYGTHVLTDFTIGGRLNFMFKSKDNSNMSSEDRENTVKAGLYMSFKAMAINVDATVSSQIVDTYSNKNTNRELIINYFGGEGSGASYNLETGYPSVNVSSWESSVDYTNAALTKIAWNKAIPIWEFTTDLNKKNQLKDAVANHLMNSQHEFLNVTPVTGCYFTKETMYYIPIVNYCSTFPTYSQLCTLGYTKGYNVSFYSDYSYVYGYVLKNQISGTQPIYLYIKNFGSNSQTKFLYTTTLINDPVYTYIGLLGYAYTSLVDGTLKPVPKSAYSYTTNFTEGTSFYVIAP